MWNMEPARDDGVVDAKVFNEEEKEGDKKKKKE